MSQLDQIQITFASAEDRMLMRLSTEDGAEFRFWLTRRFVRALRPALGEVLFRQPRISVQANPAARQELVMFEHEKAVLGSDFKTPYKGEAKALPLGEQPVLLTRFQLRPRDERTYVLTVAPERGRGVDLALDEQLLHSVIALLDHALKGAEWDLEFPAGPGGDGRQAVAPAALN